VPLASAFVAAEPASIVVTALKQAEDGADTILRCSETAGVTTDATLRLPAWNRTIEATFTPFEIKTFRVPKDQTQPVRETDLIEWA
jgi:alpha-mannosidase